MKTIHERSLLATVLCSALLVTSAFRVVATSEQGSPKTSSDKEQWSCGYGSQDGDSCTYQNCTSVGCWGTVKSDCQESRTCGDVQSGTCHVTTVGGTNLYDCR